MTAETAIIPRMTSDEFLVWAARQPGDAKYELHDGLVVPKGDMDEATGMAGERRLHGMVKRNVLASLLPVKLPCAPYVDGVAVKIDEGKTYIPDVLVDCGDQSDMAEMTAAEPVIVVEVLSDSTSKTDMGAKLEGYFSVPSVLHYLIVDGADRRVIYHMRDGDRIATQILHTGSLTLDPPAVTITIDDFWRGLPEEEAA